MYYPDPNASAYMGGAPPMYPVATSQYPIPVSSPGPQYPMPSQYPMVPTAYPPSSSSSSTYYDQPPAPYPTAYQGGGGYSGATYPPPSASFPSSSPSPSSSSSSNPSKRALLVGINYVNTPTVRLNGCINDATYLKFLLISKFGFLEQNLIVLTDDATDPSRRPTKYNMLNAINWLTTGVVPGDQLFFSFSGHGSQTRDLDGDEADGMDETILPEDYKTAGSIVDDDLHRILAARIPYGAKLTCIMDCCHSGTGMDLPYIYSGGKVTTERTAAYKSTQGDVILFSSCLDHQTAADSKNLSRVAFSGVLTFTFCQSIETHYPYLSHASLLQTMQRFSAAKGFSQIIQMSSGKPMDLNTPFVM